MTAGTSKEARTETSTECPAPESAATRVPPRTCGDFRCRSQGIVVSPSAMRQATLQLLQCQRRAPIAGTGIPDPARVPGPLGPSGRPGAARMRHNDVHRE